MSSTILGIPKPSFTHNIHVEQNTFHFKHERLGKESKTTLPDDNKCRTFLYRCRFKPLCIVEWNYDSSVRLYAYLQYICARGCVRLCVYAWGWVWGNDTSGREAQEVNSEWQLVNASQHQCNPSVLNIFPFKTCTNVNTNTSTTLLFTFGRVYIGSKRL